MYLVPDPIEVSDRLRSRRDAADRHRLVSALRAEAARRRAERLHALRREVGFGLVEVGLRLAAPPRQAHAPTSRRGA